GAWKTGSQCEWVLSVTNFGPNRARSTRIDMRMPTGMYFAEAAVPPIYVQEPQASLPVGNLEPGQSKEIKVRAIAQTALFSGEVVASTRSTAADPQLNNNVAHLAQPIVPCQVPTRVDALPLPAQDLVFDPVSQMIYLGCSELQPGVTNVLVVFDPARGTIVRQIRLPGRPGKLAVSSAG